MDRVTGGCRGREGYAPPMTQNLFIFMQFLGKIGQIIGWRPSYGFGTPSGKSWIRHCMLYIEKYNEVAPHHLNLMNTWKIKCRVSDNILSYLLTSKRAKYRSEPVADPGFLTRRRQPQGANPKAPTYYLATFFPKTA